MMFYKYIGPGYQLFSSDETGNEQVSLDQDGAPQAFSQIAIAYIAATKAIITHGDVVHMTTWLDSHNQLHQENPEMQAALLTFDMGTIPTAINQAMQDQAFFETLV